MNINSGRDTNIGGNVTVNEPRSGGWFEKLLSLLKILKGWFKWTA
jgi:hypothetical protein